VADPVLVTERLTLHEHTMEDLDFIAAMSAKPEVMRHFPAPYTREDSIDFIERQRARYVRDGHALWLARERSSGLPVGTMGLLAQEVDGEPFAEVGYRLDSPHWGRGFATEAGLAIRDWAFAVRAERAVISLIVPENHPSRAVARRLGMTLWRRWPHSGVDHLVFRLDRSTLGPASGA